MQEERGEGLRAVPRDISMKRGAEALLVLSVLTVALLSSSVLADPSVIFGPLSAYETNRVSFDLNISNWGNSYEITSVQATVDGFDVTYMNKYEGWTESSEGSTALWSEGSIANNIILASFEFIADAHVVGSDESHDATVTLVDSEAQSHTYTFPVEILDDTSPPELNSVLPQDGGFIKQGTAEQAVQVNATDPETGIENVTLHWIRCNFSENVTPIDHTLQLAEYSGLYRNTIDLSAYQDEQHVCFDFTAYNRGGERSQYSGRLTVDGVPPEVTLVSPVDSTTIGLSKNFSFFAADNLATLMTCDMYIDGNEYMTDIEAAHMDVVFVSSADVAEGEHTWSMKCADPAGWEGESATWTYNLDKTPPRIEMTSPENNSQINDEILRFNVSDNFGLYKVWLIIDGNRTEVDGEFMIETADWPEGPSEFAVRAQDTVRNQAEQTYRVIIDRTPPQVELISPAESGESDVHTDFTYRVLDDYDDEIDCSVYLDDAGLERHEAQQGTETTWPTLVATGEHRWKVQCVDDAGNTGESDERNLSVVDLSGPDIAVNIPETVFRGDPVELSLTVTDISGVETVSAELTGPHDSTQTISLERVGETYTALVETTTSSTEGTYTVEVYAVDTLNHSSQAEGEYELTYRYIVAMELEPETAAPEQSVVASGIVMYDNGSAVPEESLSILLPNSTVEAAIEDGEFSHVFTAPVLEGEYELTSLVLAGNGHNFTSTRKLTVQLPQMPQVLSHGGGSGGGGHGGTHISSDDSVGSSCSSDWSCIAWSTCEGGEQERICVDLNSCDSSDKKRTETRSCNDNENKEDEDDDETGEGDAVSAIRKPLPKPEKHTVDATEEDQGSAAGIGKATGFMSTLDVSLLNVLFALLLMTVLMGTLYRYGWGKGDNRKKPAAVDLLGGRGNKVDLDSYLADRAARRRF